MGAKQARFNKQTKQKPPYCTFLLVSMLSPHLLMTRLERLFASCPPWPFLRDPRMTKSLVSKSSGCAPVLTLLEGSRDSLQARSPLLHHPRAPPELHSPGPCSVSGLPPQAQSLNASTPGAHF